MTRKTIKPAEGLNVKFFWKNNNKQPKDDSKAVDDKTKSLKTSSVGDTGLESPDIIQDKLKLLTKRERETLFHLLQGRTMRETAQKMGISIATINTYANAIYKKFKVNSRVQLVIECHDLLPEQR